MIKRFVWILMFTLILCGGAFVAAGDDDQDEKRAKIDAMAKEAMDELMGKSAAAKELFAEAVGYAVFDNLKVAVGISGGGGSGVAVTKDGDRTYMKMGTGGIGIGLGAKKYQVIFLFQNDKTFENFIEKGWQADASAQAAAGDKAAEQKVDFSDGLAIYQFTEKGLVASADVAGTKYWKNKKLNE